MKPAPSVMLFENDGLYYDGEGNLYTMQSGSAVPAGTKALTDAEFAVAPEHQASCRKATVAPARPPWWQCSRPPVQDRRSRPR